MSKAAAVLLLWLVALPSLAQRVEARLDRELVIAGEPVVLQLRSEADVLHVELPPSDDFVVQSRQAHTSVSILNGAMTRQTVHTFVLSPLRVGSLSLGPLTVTLASGDSERVGPFSVRVVGDPAELQRIAEAQASGAAVEEEGSAAPAPMVTMPPLPMPSRSPAPGKPPAPVSAGGTQETTPGVPPAPLLMEQAPLRSELPSEPGREPFLLATVSTASPVEGAPFLVDYFFFSPRGGRDHEATDLTEPAFTGAWFRDVSELRRPALRALGPRVLDGRFFDVHLVRSFLVVPTRAGSWVAPPLELVVIENSLMRRGGARTLRSAPLELEVAPLPEGGGGSNNVGRYRWSWEVGPRELRVGDSVQVRLSATGVGAPSRLVLPELQVEGALRRFDPVDATDQELVPPGWQQVSIHRTITLQAREEGELRITVPDLVWYDPWVGAWERASGQTFVLQVRGVNPSVELGDEEQVWGEVAWLQRLPAPRPVSGAQGVMARMRAAEPWNGSWLYVLLFALPIVSLVVWSLLGATRARRSALAERRRVASAERRLLGELSRLRHEDRSSFGQLQGLWHGYLETRAGLVARGMTSAELRTALRSSWPIDRADELESILQALETARYGGGDEGSFTALLERSRRWVEAVAQEEVR